MASFTSMNTTFVGNDNTKTAMNATTATTMTPVPTPLTPTPASLAHAVLFLTGPLIATLAPRKLTLLQSTLQTAIIRNAFLDKDHHINIVRLTFTPRALPPAPVVHAAEVAGVPLSGWMALFKNQSGVERTWELVIEPRSVSVEYPGVAGARVVVWSEMSAVPSSPRAAQVPAPIARPTKEVLARVAVSGTSKPDTAAAVMEEGLDASAYVPISKFAQLKATSPSSSPVSSPTTTTTSSTQASLLATLSSARARAQERQRTLAQQLMESDGQAGADEVIAARRTSLTIRGPAFSATPKRERFPESIHDFMFPGAGADATTMPFAFPSAAHPFMTPTTAHTLTHTHRFVPSPTSTRPSSPSHSSSSSTSGFTFSDDDAESLADGSVTSVSSIDSVDFIYSTSCPGGTTTTTVPLSPYTKEAVFTRPPPHVLKEMQAAREARELQKDGKAYVDPSKKDVTKYLYQGGVSTVLTGGVMLGGPSAQSSPAKSSSAKSSPMKSSPWKPSSSAKSFSPRATPRPAFATAPTVSPTPSPSKTTPKYKAPIGGTQRWATSATACDSWRRPSPRV
ncbi:hypothetical protein BDN70DRAFT_482002 [Pholiota conissans]|uniref:Uncharacterized protein n=1 Tax=Pholiota conissans TaxID=109636 RepID=A0A9P5YNH1_9AGAR|nr:hypothetical protein BDN70DRAFT_482002 [Pholiota conissans]